MRGQEVYPVANKSEYIRKRVCIEKIPQRTEVQETEKGKLIVWKVYKENQKELAKMYNFSCLCKL